MAKHCLELISLKCSEIRILIGNGYTSNNKYRRYLKRQINLFYLALSFFTRIPVPQSMYYSPVLLNKSGRYFSLIGLLLAGILSLLFTLISPLFPDTISIALLVIVSLLLTGAFHEDGLADMADGIGGGMTVEKRLTIMKDSRIGTYGAVTLFMALALKLLVLIELAQIAYLIPSLFLGYALSRAVAASLIYDLPYVADIDTSKSKPLANKQSPFELRLLFIVGLAPLLFFSLTTALLLILTLFIFRAGFKQWLIKRIGGYTGDCLGACQQLSELLIYLVILASFTSFGQA
ncbi:adenosylcobinamide-GDP ribazoletransferase [Pseudocolwellia agarivorans]|uniref:adenosylcobinamide-GDP ribazoletransferase n=1 Tax=Pseudocolwellia agarivorans TaxID=1911682 RepID=UPI0009863181|nr:adenosylcobinamide-GDP ribazoletransferase [Pseudocolwellia agarivorans]